MVLLCSIYGDPDRPTCISYLQFIPKKVDETEQPEYIHVTFQMDLANH